MGVTCAACRHCGGRASGATRGRGPGRRLGCSSTPAYGTGGNVPMFHMEHCVFAVFLSTGTDHREDDVWMAALAGQLPASPDALRRAVNARRDTARLTDLQRLVDCVRARERKEDDFARREQWRVVRGAVHQALAARNSRLALYDLRDSLLEPERLPVAFLAAIEEIGDASCVETLAAAYDASSRSGDTWWREHLASAFHAIVHREGLTRRHAAIKRALARWPSATAELMTR